MEVSPKHCTVFGKVEDRSVRNEAWNCVSREGVRFDEKDGVELVNSLHQKADEIMTYKGSLKEGIAV